MKEISLKKGFYFNFFQDFTTILFVLEIRAKYNKITFLLKQCYTFHSNKKNNKGNFPQKRVFSLLQNFTQKPQ